MCIKILFIKLPQRPYWNFISVIIYYWKNTIQGQRYIFENWKIVNKINDMQYGKMAKNEIASIKEKR